MPAGTAEQSLPGLQHGIRLPAGASAGASRPARQASPPAAPSGQQPPRNRHAAGQLLCFLPRRPLPGTSIPPSLPVALTTALCPDSVPPCAVPCSQPDQSAFPTDPPLHRRKALPILSRSMAARKQAREIKKKLRPSSLPSIPLLSGRMACPISNNHQTTPGTSGPT